MMTLVNTKRLALLAWAIANVSLVLLIGVELGWGKKWAQPMPVPVVHLSAPVEIVLPPDYRLPALEKAYAGVLDRPLFVVSRRKAPPLPPPPPPSMKKGQFQLLGTIITDELRAAIVREIASGKVREVVYQQVINGLRLEQVEPSRIVFTQYDDSEELRLKIQPSPKKLAPVPAENATETRSATETSAAPDRRQRPRQPGRAASTSTSSSKEVKNTGAPPTPSGSEEKASSNVGDSIGP